MVKSILYYVGKGWDWDQISYAYEGVSGRDEIAKAVNLASQSLIEKTEKRRRAA
jgi:hypothetical protein